MSGLEPFIASALASVGTAGTAAAGTTAAATTAGAAATAGAVGAGVASAGELALLASAGQALTASGGTGLLSGLTAGQALTGASALSGLAGAGAQLLAEAPKFDLPSAPTRDTAKQEADARSMQLKRRGRAATLLTGSQGVTSNPTLGSPALTGTA